MSSTTNKIAELNDRFRKATRSDDPAGLSLGRKVMTRGLNQDVIHDDMDTPEEYRWSGTRTGHYSDELPQRASLEHWAEQLSR